MNGVRFSVSPLLVTIEKKAYHIPVTYHPSDRLRGERWTGVFLYQSIERITDW